MAGLFTVTNKLNGLTADVYFVKDSIIGGKSTVEFLVYNTRTGTFAYQPSQLYSVASGGIDLDIPVNDLTIETTTTNLELGKTLELAVSYVPTDATIKNLVWESSDADIVTISNASDAGCTLTPVSIGRVFISAKAQSGASTNIEINVVAQYIPATGLTLIPSTITIPVGEEASCTGLISPGNASNRTLIWQSSNTACARVTDFAANICYIYGASPGTANLTAKNAADEVVATCVVTVQSIAPRSVANYDELVEAIADVSVNTINIQNNFPLSDTVAINRSLHLNGNNCTLIYSEDAFKDGIIVSANGVTISDLTIHMTNDDPAWEGHYGIQVYAADGVILNNITSSGEDAGILINGSRVAMTGNINISANEFGGIEVSKGSALTVNSVLDVTEANFINITEKQNNPTIWVIDGQGSIIGSTMLTENIRADLGQIHYYLNPANVWVAATGIIISPDTALLAADQDMEVVVQVQPYNASNNNFTTSVSDTSKLLFMSEQEGVWFVKVLGSAQMDDVLIGTATTEDGGFTSTITITVT